MALLFGMTPEVSVPIIGQLADLAVADAMMIAAGQKAARVGEHIAVV